MAVLTEVEANVRLNRGDASAINLPRVRETSIEAMAGLVKDVSDASFEIVKQRQSATMLREMSDLKLRQDARLLEMAQNTAPGESIVEQGIDGFVKEANDFISRQPSYLRDDARKNMLNLRDSTASTVLGLQASLDAEKIKLDTEAFTNNLLNDVRFGNLSAADAAAAAEEYSLNLPGRIKDEVKKEMVDGVGLMSLARMVDDNPRAAQKAIKSGKYDYLDPIKLDSIFSAAERKIEQEQNAAIALQNKATQRLFAGDYAEFAKFNLAAKGVSDPTNDQLIQEQLEAGLSPNQLSILTKNEAKFFADRLNSATDIDDFIAVKADILSQYVTEDEQAVVTQNLINHGELSEMASVLIGNEAYTPDGDMMKTAVFNVAINPEAGTAAKADWARYKELQNDTTSADRIDLEIARNLQRERNIMVMQGVPFAQADKRIAGLEAAAYVAVRDKLALKRDISTDDVQNLFDGFGDYSADQNFSFPVRKQVEHMINERGARTAMQNVLEGSNVAFVVIDPETGKREVATKTSNNVAYSDMVDMLRGNVNLSWAGKIGAEDAYYVKDTFGNFIQKVTTVNGKEAISPVLVTERDLIYGTKKDKQDRSEKSLTSIKEGF